MYHTRDILGSNQKQDGSFKYVKIHFKTAQGIKNLTRQEAEKLAGEDANHHTRDLFEAIERGDYPGWNVYVQVMDPKDAEQYHWNIFDMTRTWPHKDYPLRPIGKVTLNENVSSSLYLTSQERTR
jgi:catalase